MSILKFAAEQAYELQLNDKNLAKNYHPRNYSDKDYQSWRKATSYDPNVYSQEGAEELYKAYNTIWNLSHKDHMSQDAMRDIAYRQAALRNRFW